MTDPGNAVFISYASQDTEAARHLCNALRAAGIEVWFDQSELRGGDAWDQMIRRQIKGCYLFVPMISASTQSREEGYARGEWDEARRHIDAAISIDPLIAIDHYFSAEVRLAAGRTEEAETEARRVLEISPSYAWARYLLAKILVARGRPAEAIEVIQTEPDEEGRLYGIEVAQFTAGHHAASDNALHRLTALAANDWAFGIAAVHASRGEADDAFRWLERAYTQRDPDLNLLKANRQLDSVRSDARYAAFLRKMNLPE